MNGIILTTLCSQGRFIYKIMGASTHHIYNMRKRVKVFIWFTIFMSNCKSMFISKNKEYKYFKNLTRIKGNRLAYITNAHKGIVSLCSHSECSTLSQATGQDDFIPNHFQHLYISRSCQSLKMRQFSKLHYIDSLHCDYLELCNGSNWVLINKHSFQNLQPFSHGELEILAAADAPCGGWDLHYNPGRQKASMTLACHNKQLTEGCAQGWQHSNIKKNKGLQKCSYVKSAYWMAEVCLCYWSTWSLEGRSDIQDVVKCLNSHRRDRGCSTSLPYFIISTVVVSQQTWYVGIFHVYCIGSQCWTITRETE